MNWCQNKTKLLLLLLAATAWAQEPIKSDGSDIGITIMGAIIQEDSASNVALIKEQSGTVKAIKRDHVILNQYKVVSITAKYIELITRDARRHLVYQDKFSSAIASKSPPLQAAPSLASVSDQYKEEGFERNKGVITMSAMYRDKLVKEDLAKVLMQATAEPHLENGSIVGFKMYQIDEDSIYHKAGLQNEDIITAINGQELNNVAAAIGLLRSLKGFDHVNVDLRRGGQTLKITIDVR